mmetsp:Transcript_30087/g.88002  ORF Transcript_30087/g.88002 Transcript_30087/m.88002 type:complete len:328 (+) Transcript_30087:619-1602(+)
MNRRKLVAAGRLGGSGGVKTGKQSKKSLASSSEDGSKKKAVIRNITVRKPQAPPSMAIALAAATSGPLPPEFSFAWLENALEEMKLEMTEGLKAALKAHVEQIFNAQNVDILEAAAESLVVRMVEETARNFLEGTIADIKSVKANALTMSSTVASIESLRTNVEMLDDKVADLSVRIDLLQISNADQTRTQEDASKDIAVLASQLRGFVDRFGAIETLKLASSIEGIEERLLEVETSGAKTALIAEAANATAEACTMQSESRTKRLEAELDQKLETLVQEKQSIEKNKSMIKRILSQMDNVVNSELRSLREDVDSMRELLVHKGAAA